MGAIRIMTIRILPINGLNQRSTAEGKVKGQQWSAQSTALGIGVGNKRPARAKEFSLKSFFCPYRAWTASPVSPGRCPGLGCHRPYRPFYTGFSLLAKLELYYFILRTSINSTPNRRAVLRSSSLSPIRRRTVREPRRPTA